MINALYHVIYAVMALERLPFNVQLQWHKGQGPERLYHVLHQPCCQQSTYSGLHEAYMYCIITTRIIFKILCPCYQIIVIKGENFISRKRLQENDFKIKRSLLVDLLLVIFSRSDKRSWETIRWQIYFCLGFVLGVDDGIPQ